MWHSILLLCLLAAGCGSKTFRITVDGIKHGTLVLDNQHIVISELASTLQAHGYSADTSIIVRDLDLNPTKESTNAIVVVKIDKDTTQENVRGVMDTLIKAGYWRITFIDIKQKKD